jgi:FMN phosphatase YigB (HAD superfamily)
MDNTPKIVVWDWHGVLGVHGFWHKAAKENKEVARLAGYIFSDKERVYGWMRGEVSIQNLLTKTSAELSKEELAEHLLSDWGVSDAINTQLVSAVKSIYPNARHVIVTDNMDVFSDYAKKNTYIAQNFERIFNSYEYGVLKDDQNGLFESAMSELGLSSFEDCLLLDDSPTNCQRFESLGGKAILIDGGYR